MLTRRSILLAFGAAVLLVPKAVQATEADAWAALKSNIGAIVLFRHAEAPGFGDPDNFKPGDCSTQRNLADSGRRQARRIGERFQAEQVTVAKVLSSQWCRTTETAELAFPGKVTSDATFNSFFNDSRDEPQQTRQARTLLSAWKGPGTLVVVTHQVNITALTGIVAASGEGIALRVNKGQLTVIGRITP
jgi:phosphohistidine phosphatase SixA